MDHEDCKIVVGCRPLGGGVRYSALKSDTRAQSAIADALARRSSAYYVCPILDLAILVYNGHRVFYRGVNHDKIE